MSVLANIRNRRRFFVWLGLIAAVWLAWRFWSADDSARRVMGMDAPPVRVATALAQNVPHFLNGLGTVEPSVDVLVKSRVDGQLLRLHFQEGQRVKAGDLLA
ncbi:MAG: biotin/lipoyl-binding protein, partial [Desulfovibrionaceae bacterium]|nr:biotin/lipoyl-binding protein [Desulfovibrionaceae bacterium]